MRKIANYSWAEEGCGEAARATTTKRGEGETSGAQAKLMHRRVVEVGGGWKEVGGGVEEVGGRRWVEEVRRSWVEGGILLIFMDFVDFLLCFTVFGEQLMNLVKEYRTFEKVHAKAMCF